MKRPLAYITAHWGDNEFENTENAAKYCRLVYEAGFSPVCPLLFLPLFLKDSIPQEHKDGIDMARDYLRRASVLVSARWDCRLRRLGCWERSRDCGMQFRTAFTGERAARIWYNRNMERRWRHGGQQQGLPGLRQENETAVHRLAAL